MPESPRWLIFHGHYQRALEVLKKAATVNGKTLPDDHLLLATMDIIKQNVRLYYSSYRITYVQYAAIASI